MKQPIHQAAIAADLDAQISLLLNKGMPVCERPFLNVAKQLGMGEMALILRVQHLIKQPRMYAVRKNSKNISGKLSAGNIYHITPAPADTVLSSWDKNLLTLLRQGLPLSSRPYHLFARHLEITLDEVLFRADRLQARGLINTIPVAKNSRI
ncbi:MAG: hypothetical protein MI976_13125 [Pseudomonadales bacterium]|nr:hypothetical protein [Pseudomonadales bacterium]